MPSIGLQSLGVFLKDIKLSHSIFALPFAASALLFDLHQWPTQQQIILLLICMVAGRSYAMGTNRLIDFKIDALNSRTATRALPSGSTSFNKYLFWTLLSALCLIVGAFYLNMTVGYLSFVLIAILTLYGYLKRFTPYVHWYLGFCLAISPIAVLLALGVFPSTSVLLLSFAVMVWTAGFDILYALQDMSFDKQHQLYSMPAKLGALKSKNISFLSFALMVLLLIAIGFMRDVSWIYNLGIAGISFLFFYMYLSLKDLDESGKSSNINKVFFDINALVGVLYLMVVVLDRLL